MNSSLPAKGPTTDALEVRHQAEQTLSVLRHDSSPFGTTTIPTRQAISMLEGLLAALDATERELSDTRDRLAVELGTYGLTVDEIMTGPVKLGLIAGVNIKLLQERNDALRDNAQLDKDIKTLIGRKRRYEEALREIAGITDQHIWSETDAEIAAEAARNALEEENA